MGKGITPVIAVILLLLITISIVGVAFTFFARTAETTTKAGEEQLTQQMKLSSSQPTIDGASGGKVYIRNTGNSNLEGLLFYADRDLKSYTGPSSLPPNQIGEYTLANFSAEGVTVIKVTSGGFSDETSAETPRSCKGVLADGKSTGSGLYIIKPYGSGSFEAYCDMTTDGGGWTLVGKTIKAGLTQAEKDAIRMGTWADYTQKGYGDPSSGSRIYWLPLSRWNLLTRNNPTAIFRSATTATELRVKNFFVGDESQKYAWTWSGPVTNTEPNPAQKNAKFTTHDSDNDVWSANCAKDNVGYNGGWWYTDCYQVSMLHSDNNVYALFDNVGTPVEYNYLYIR